MAITAKVLQSNQLKARLSQQKEIVAQTVKVGSVELDDLSDVSTQGAIDGSLLVYNATTQKFELTTELANENININAGNY